MQVLFTKEQIAKRVREIAGEISRKYAGRPLTLVGVLRGGAPFLVDLMRELKCGPPGTAAPTIDVEIDFISVGSYGAAQESSGVVTIHKDLTGDISGRNVIIVDDICDSGRPIAKLKKMFERMAASGAPEAAPPTCEVAVVLSKPSRRVVDV
ncbi:MAG: hypothetical protein FWE47_01040, partial [Oscillospiraceae bacterium]|nr:hypothetical protein [Oscillospiraceae bacterium]